MRLCLVGPGAIGEAHLRALLGAALVDPAWVVGRTLDSAERFAATWKIENFTADIDAALADPTVDLVLVASPNDLHAAQTIAALDAGKHVITEIPVAMTLDDALAISAKAVAVGRRCLVCHTKRSFPAIRTLRQQVGDGRLTLSHIAGFAGIPRRHNENWVGGHRSWVDNLLWHNSCHYLDAALWVAHADDFENVTAQFGKSHSDFGMTMDVCVSFRALDRLVVTYSGSYNVATGVSYLFFVSDEGMFTFVGNQLIDERGIQLYPIAEWGELDAQDRAMIRDIESGSVGDFDVSSVLPVMRLLHQAQLLDA